jgi:hypothetical protein
VLRDIDVDRSSGEKNATQHRKKLKYDEHVFPGSGDFLSQIGMRDSLACAQKKSGCKPKLV